MAFISLSGWKNVKIVKTAIDPTISNGMLGLGEAAAVGGTLLGIHLINRAVEHFDTKRWEREKAEARAAGTCVDCGQPATSFRHDAAKERYHEVSATCQPCQDTFDTNWGRFIDWSSGSSR